MATTTTVNPSTMPTTYPEFTGTSSDPTILPMSKLTKYNLYYTPSMLNATLHIGDISSPATYYMQSKSMRLHPTMLIRRGPTKDSPIVSFVKCSYISRHMTIGLGDCEAKSKSKHNDDDTDNPVSMQELSRDKNILRRSDYRFSVEDPTATGAGTTQTREFVWAKDRHVQRSSVYNCLDADGNVVGRMLSGGMFNWMKGGEVHVDEGGLSVGMRDLIVAGAFAVWVFEALSYRSPLRGYPKTSKEEREAENRAAAEMQAAKQRAAGAEAVTQVVQATASGYDGSGGAGAGMVHHGGHGHGHGDGGAGAAHGGDGGGSC